MERRKAERVVFANPLPATLVSTDGTRRVDCRIEDISEAGAKIHLPRGGMFFPDAEFFMVMASRGQVYRRCQRRWTRDDRLGAQFLVLKDSVLVPRARFDHADDDAQA